MATIKGTYKGNLRNEMTHLQSGNTIITDAQKAMLKRAADTCPVGRSLHPDVKVNLEMRF